MLKAVAAPTPYGKGSIAKTQRMTSTRRKMPNASATSVPFLRWAGALGRAIAAAEQARAAWQAIGCIKLLLATGLRKDKALLRWSRQTDLNGRRLVFAETKTGGSVCRPR